MCLCFCWFWFWYGIVYCFVLLIKWSFFGLYYFGLFYNRILIFYFENIFYFLKFGILFCDDWSFLIFFGRVWEIYRIYNIGVYIFFFFFMKFDSIKCYILLCVEICVIFYFNLMIYLKYVIVEINRDFILYKYLLVI